MKVTVSKILKSDYITLLCKFQPPVVLQIINQKVWAGIYLVGMGSLEKVKMSSLLSVICCPWYGSILMINVGDNIIKSNGKDLSRFICYSQLAETQQWNSTREKCDRAELISVSAQNSSPNVLKKN